VKHVKAVTRKAPEKADAVQEIICEVAQFISALLGSLGGTSPLLGFVEDKCDLPEPS
jgi:hypothetical protein